MATSTRPFTSPAPPLLFLLFYSLFSLLSFYTHISAAADADILSFGQSLSGGRTLVSKGGTFELGFFLLGSSGKYYAGIRFRRIPPKTIVWIANRERPLVDPATSELKIFDNGELVLLNSQSKIPLWSSNSTGTEKTATSRNPNSTVAVLLETGNLVLRDGSSPAAVAGKFLWQSFEHPGDTLLPGSRIGYNKTTGQIWKLTSWRSFDDPSPGIFTLQLDPSGVVQAIIQWNETRTFWWSGPWDGHIFSLVPEMMALKEYSIDLTSGGGGYYVTYADSEIGGLSTMWMDVAGQWKWQKWSEDTQSWLVFSFMPKDPCSVYLRCGAFGTCTQATTPACACLPGFLPNSTEEWKLGDQTGGCVRRTPLQCGDGKGNSSGSVNGGQKDGFLVIPNIQLPINSEPLAAVRGAQDCELDCLNDCSCTAYSYGGGGGCLIWRGSLLNMRQVSGVNANGGQSGDLHLRLARSDLPIPEKKKGNATTAAIIGAIAGVAVLVCIALVLLFWRNRRRRLTQQALSRQGFLVPFRYRDLQRATKNFSDRLGKGGFGSVYKGTLPDSSSVVAVKKLEGLGQGEKQFRMEVTAMGTVQHVNVVRLRGFCCEGARRLLVYDYMPSGSLDSYLYPKCSGDGLDWDRRYQIAVGTARGLHYLHDKCRERIIHCDVKPENILLDGAFCPKVADFGMAKLVGRDFSRVLTTMRGTLGYLAPEWISGVPITPKADVYSFGMMLFEIMSGRRNGEEPEEGRPSFFPSWAARGLEHHEDDDDELPKFTVGAPDDHTKAEEVRRACKVACWCVQEDEDERPSMGKVVQMLEGVVEVDMPPVPKLLRNLAATGEEIVFILETHSFACSKVSTASSGSTS